MDSEAIRDAVRTKYRTVAATPEGRFSYPVGRASAEGLGYDAAWLDGVPQNVVAVFVGVGNPFRVAVPSRDDVVLDVGCGAGLDVFVAARLTGPGGHVAGIDLTPEMIEVASRALHAGADAPIDLAVGTVEALPYPDNRFDLVFSNGALNLVPDKAKAFLEIRRVLKPGGTLACADLVLTESLPDDVKASLDAWSTWVAGALSAAAWRTHLEDAGFDDVEFLGPTGYVTSRYTRGEYLRARKGARASAPVSAQDDT